jgi:tRNA (guanine37-N1)-methyltransferase
MRIDVITLFPEIFSGFLDESLLARAIARGLTSIRLHNLRDWAAPDSVHRQVDDRPYGGGAGMLIMVEPTVRAVEAVREIATPPGQLILLTPQGRRLDQAMVEELATQPRLLLLSGRYEGFDERVIDILQPLQVSIGDYVLNGGEVAAMVLIECVVRLLPGVLGDPASHVSDSFSGDERLLDYPQYTRPRSFRGHDVPDVLLSGNHQQIDAWRTAQARERTSRRQS